MIARRALVICLLLAAAACSRRGVADIAADREQLLRLHEKVMQAHRQSSIGAILEDEPEEYIVVNRGEVTHPSRAERRERMGTYLRRSHFTVYEDLVEPLVRVSTDGSLGWVIVQVRARGVQRYDDGSDQPLEFVSGWIELYEKKEARWLRIGNVSNFKP